MYFITRNAVRIDTYIVLLLHETSGFPVMTGLGTWIRIVTQSHGTADSKCCSRSSGGTSSPAKSTTRAAACITFVAAAKQYLSTLPSAFNPWSNLTSVGTVTSGGSHLGTFPSLSYPTRTLGRRSSTGKGTSPRVVFGNRGNPSWPSLFSLNGSCGDA